MHGPFAGAVKHNGLCRPGAKGPGASGQSVNAGEYGENGEALAEKNSHFARLPAAREDGIIKTVHCTVFLFADKRPGRGAKGRQAPALCGGNETTQAMPGRPVRKEVPADGTIWPCGKPAVRRALPVCGACEGVCLAKRPCVGRCAGGIGTARCPDVPGRHAAGLCAARSV